MHRIPGTSGSQATDMALFNVWARSPGCLAVSAGRKRGDAFQWRGLIVLWSGSWSDKKFDEFVRQNSS